MKKVFFLIVITASAVYFSACSSGTDVKSSTESKSTAADAAGQSGVQDDVSSKNVVQIAVGSKDHSTLVAAVKAANLVDALSNAGPFTVFAPTNAAFDALPAGTVDGLLKPEKLETLTDILQYHVSLGVFKSETFTDGQVIGQVNGGNIRITKKEGKLFVNGEAEIIASIPASNGMIHVINKVLLPPAVK